MVASRSLSDDLPYKLTLTLTSLPRSLHVLRRGRDITNTLYTRLLQSFLR